LNALAVVKIKKIRLQIHIYALQSNRKLIIIINKGFHRLKYVVLKAAHIEIEFIFRQKDYITKTHLAYKYLFMSICLQKRKKKQPNYTPFKPFKRKKKKRLHHRQRRRYIYIQLINILFKFK
jgi:hypothetical protein